MVKSASYFADKGILAENGTTGLYGAGKTKELRVAIEHLQQDSLTLKAEH